VIKGGESVHGDLLDIPSNVTAGQKLKDGSFTYSAGTGKGTMSIGVTVSDRKAVSIENITTPAGTFNNCIKISYRMTVNMMTPMRQDIIEWYAVNVGMVRMEQHDLGGTLKGYSVLESIPGN
jgi:hypothetical protein